MAPKRRSYYEATTHLKADLVMRQHAHSQKRGAWKPGVQTTLAPAAIDASSAPTRLWMWNSGITLRQRSRAPSARVAPIWWAEAHRLRSVSGTILGRAVVPDVCSTSATSSGAAGARCVTGRRALPESVKTPAGSSSRGENDHRPGMQVGEVEIELRRLVRRVERRAGRGGGDSQESYSRLGAIGKDERDAIAVAEPKARKGCHDGIDLLPQAPIGERAAVGGNESDGFRRRRRACRNQVVDTLTTRGG